MTCCFALPHTPERQTFARRLLMIYAAVSLPIAPMSYVDGNPLILGFALFALVTIPLVLRASTRSGQAQLPIYFSLGLLMAIVMVGAFDQMHRTQNLIWLLLYPFMLLYLAGLRCGSLLLGLIFAAMVAIYAAYPLMERPERIPLSHFLQIQLAFITASVLAYYQEFIRKQHEECLQRLSEQDHLTGLDNRRSFLAKAAPILAQAQRLQQPFCIILLDLDDFKCINDRHGHEAGDAALRMAAEVIRRHSREYDLVARWGGEEFVLLLPQCTAEGGWQLAEKLRRLLSEQPLPCGMRLTASFGLALHEANDSIDTVISRADQQMYQAKTHGKNRVFPDSLALGAAGAPSAA